MILDRKFYHSTYKEVIVMKNPQKSKDISKEILFCLDIIFGGIFIFIFHDYIGDRYTYLSLPNRKTITTIFFLCPMIIAAFGDAIINFVTYKLFNIKKSEFYTEIIMLIYFLLSMLLLRFSNYYLFFVDKTVYVLFG